MKTRRQRAAAAAASSQPDDDAIVDTLVALDDARFLRVMARAHDARARSGRGTGGVQRCGVDVLSKAVEFLALDEAPAVKSVSRAFRSAARRALTRGRWRPFRQFSARGMIAVRGDAPPQLSDSTVSLFREVWALDSGAVVLELASWVDLGNNGMVLEGALRFLDAVVARSIDHVGQVVGALGRVAEQIEARELHPFAINLLATWMGRALDGDDGALRRRLLEGPFDLGIRHWKSNKLVAARMIVTYGHLRPDDDDLERSISMHQDFFTMYALLAELNEDKRRMARAAEEAAAEAAEVASDSGSETYLSGAEGE
mmetsp:Transcript_18346/g.54515  ORF Transcript_18346/g.54515 Transcript_18346/m.54515 type:complete len:314 (+) Transcript_18346:186-1127(+)